MSLLKCEVANSIYRAEEPQGRQVGMVHEQAARGSGQHFLSAGCCIALFLHKQLQIPLIP